MDPAPPKADPDCGVCFESIPHCIVTVQQGGMCPPPPFFLIGSAMVCLCPTLFLTPHFYFPLEWYVYITLTNNYLAFFIYQLITLWTISINWHRRLLLNNHISKYNAFMLVLYRGYINYVTVCPPPPPPPTVILAKFTVVTVRFTQNVSCNIYTHPRYQQVANVTV